MENKKNWYAVQETRDDDWGIGSYDWNEAVEMAKKLGDDSIIAEIAEGENPVCVAEYINGEDF